ncbi:hypothetical protein FLBR109950_16000 [Flavobacterium branchiophilum]|uniref:Uncharacterized protein n=1 Tax=Flavobacterium branchiophilum (strain FL-15) TaxID=1034807 RepID=G2Z286_FLABF|nr:Hypothetical protein FBFL15_2008 [Flavobacterium branchiophilum FL-15]
MKLLIYIQNYIYNVFYKRIGSNKHTSFSASLSIVTLIIIVIFLIIINLLSILFYKIDIIKDVNEWLIAITILLVYILIFYNLSKIFKKRK